MVVILRRAVIRSKLPVLFSKGFHPLPRFSFGPALRVGFESRGEPVDIYLAAVFDPETVKEQLNQELPEDLKVRRVDILDQDSKKCAAAFKYVTAEVTFAVDGLLELTGSSVRRQVPSFDAEIIDFSPIPDTGMIPDCAWYRARIVLPAALTSKVEEIIRDVIGGRAITKLRVVRESFE
jgi:hypothetical protein